MAEQIVRNSSELAAAVADMNIDHIYFGNNIELSSPIAIPTNKTSLIFDGTYENVTYRFTDMNSNLLGNTLYVGGASGISLTFQNMTMTGRNYYGIPYISETGTSAVILTYRNITYVGPQLVYHIQGLTHFENVDITISPSAVSEAEEVGEVGRVEFSGNNIIRHNSTQHAVFWFRNSADTAYFRLLTNASLNIVTTNYFMFNYYFFILYPVAYEIQAGASFILESNHGISYNSSHIASSFLINMGATFRYIQETSNGTNASLYLSGNFTVSEGANVYMQADFANAQPLIDFTAGAANLFSINNPKSFVLYNRTSAPVAAAASITRSYSITTEQLNHWSTARAFPGAGSFTDIPQNNWHNAEWETFTVSGNISQTATTATAIGLIGTQLPLSNFTFQSARVISAGSLILTADPVIDNGRPISGVTEPNAALIISFNIEGIPYSFSLTADGNGRFEIDPERILPIETIIHISANTPFLIKAIEVAVISAGEVSIVSAPERIVFKPPPISTNPVLLKRFAPVDSVEVYDSRPYPTRWELLASISGPLRTSGGEVLENAVVFRDEDEILWDLGGTPLVVYTGAPLKGTTEVSWAEDKGILVRITQPIRSGAQYSTQLIWGLHVIEES